MRMMKKVRLSFFALLSVLAATPVFASATSSTLHIGTGLGSSCQAGGCYTFNSGFTGFGSGEVNNITGSPFDIYQQSNGAGPIASPLMVILAVPDALAKLAVDPMSSTMLFSNTNPYGLKFEDQGIGLVGDLTNSKPKDIYGFLSAASDNVAVEGLLTGGDNSFNYANMSGGDTVLGVFGSSTGFNIYAYALDATLSGQQGVNVGFSNLPVGTFIAAFGMNCTTSTCTPSEGYAMAITEGGVITKNNAIGGGSGLPAPEPGSLALLGTAVAALGWVVRRKRR